jgi:hypothetical protein
MSRRRSLAVLTVVLAFLAGCDRKEETAVAPATPAPAPTAKRETRIVVPQEVQGQWKAVKIAVLDKEQNREEVYTIDLGQDFPLPDSDISVQPQNFLPAFIMDGITLTSASNEPKNPAVQIVVRQKGQQIYKGWLFSIFPGTHAFQHARYSFTLVDYLPAKKG